MPDDSSVFAYVTSIEWSKWPQARLRRQLIVRVHLVTSARLQELDAPGFLAGHLGRLWKRDLSFL